MKAGVTVVGKDKTGIIAKVTTFLAEKNVNVEDISQTVLQDRFAMIMLADTGETPIGELRKGAQELGEKIGVQISVQHEDVFSAMHRI